MSLCFISNPVLSEPTRLIFVTGIFPYLDDVRVFDNLPGFLLILFGNVENIHTLSFMVSLQK